MAIRIKVATSARELDDVFKLRYEVYVLEKGRFDQSLSDSPRVVDHFDTIPGVVNVVAYVDEKAVGTIRVNQDSEVGLPAEKLFDYTATRQQILQEFSLRNSRSGLDLVPKIACCGMLAVHKDWRNRRQVIFSLLKTAIGIMHSWDSTHLICSISAETLSMYGRLGLKPVGEAEWCASISDHVIPLAATFDSVYDWAFGAISKKVDHFWLDNFSARFERVLLSPGEVLFDQNDSADYAYAVDEGLISISRQDPNGNEMVLANLSCGALFGELAIFDGEKRSAKAAALVNSELISIERTVMFDILREHPENLVQLLQHFAQRVRETDNLAMVQAFAAHTNKVSFALEQLWQSAEPDRKNPQWRSVKVGPKQLARTANVTEDEVRQDLEVRQSKGILQYGEKMIRFMQNPSDSSMLRASNDSPL